MLEFESHNEVLIEHARGRHLVKSAWFIVIALAVFIIASAQAPRSVDLGVTLQLAGEASALDLCRRSAARRQPGRGAKAREINASRT